MEELETSLRAIVDWAESEPRIKKAYLFGSYLKGTATPSSDLDIAVEIHKGPGDTSYSSAFAFDKQDFLKDLEGKVRLKLDLQLYAGESETPNVHQFLSGSSKVIYEEDI